MPGSGEDDERPGFFRSLANAFLGIGGSATASPLDSVKLIHADELRQWDEFKRCQEVEGVSYSEYKARRKHLRRLAKSVAPLLDAQERLGELESDEIVTYATEYLDVPRSVLRRPKVVPLPREPLPGTWAESTEGQLVRGGLETPAGWRKRFAGVDYKGPSRIAYGDEIGQLKSRLEAMTEDEERILSEVNSSQFADPVLFISHRWESHDHPDPSGGQLQRLKELRDCFIIYDFSSFPQPPRTEQEEEDFQQILLAMDRIIDNVVILAGDDYLTRGWCVYEYILSSLKHTIVCDEVSDPAFISLRDWVATKPPIAQNPWRNSWEAMQENYIDKNVLRLVNQILPVYGDAQFRSEHDHSWVTWMLREFLKQALPSKMEEPNPYLGGEWQSKAWTDDDLAQAFRGEMTIPRLPAGTFDNFARLKPFDTKVPTALADAVRQEYTINRMSLDEVMNPIASLARGFYRRGSQAGS
jgi:hypothetical protein